MAFGIYVHVPFCRTRCGYCDFNTYTATELGGGGAQSQYADLVCRELALARAELGDRRRVDTVFFGGGTPTLLPPADLLTMLQCVREQFELAPDAEITTEANPESVSSESLAMLRQGGLTRLSVGMQSVVPYVLEVLDRTHRPERVPQVVRWARDAGFDDVSLDLIYGTPGESLDDWRRSLDAAIGYEPDHLSAYALVVEPGTKLARKVASGEVAAPDDDDLADKYRQADATLEQAGFAWYEVSNWATSSAHHCRHNLGYWHGDEWWGVGPGAHSYIDGVRWWNVKHPSAYAQRLLSSQSPMAGKEKLDDGARYDEHVMLGVRTSRGIPVPSLKPYGRDQAGALAAEGLLDAGSLAAGQVVLSASGRLLADHVVRRLLA